MPTAGAHAPLRNSPAESMRTRCWRPAATIPRTVASNPARCRLQARIGKSALCGPACARLTRVSSCERSSTNSVQPPSLTRYRLRILTRALRVWSPAATCSASRTSAVVVHTRLRGSTRCSIQFRTSTRRTSSFVTSSSTPSSQARSRRDGSWCNVSSLFT